MSDSKLHQDLQVRSSETYGDLEAMGITLQTNPTDLQADLNALRSWLRAGNDPALPWYTAPVVTLATILAHITRANKTTRVTNADSPYTVLATDHAIFCDTSTGAITVNLPAGPALDYRIINTGTSGNRVTVTPDGADNLLGENSDVTLFDRDVVWLEFEPTEGWW